MSAFVRLLRVELTRLLHRRAVLVLLGVSLIVPAVIGVIIVLDTRPPSAAQVADAERQVELDRADPAFDEQITECLEHPEQWGITADDAAEVERQCREQAEPQLEWYLYEPQLDLASERDFGSGIAISMIVAMAMMLLGTTFTGHDWASGSVSNQLLFEPRRTRVWGAKALVVATTGLITGAVVLTSYWLGLGAVARSRDRLGDGVLLDCLQMGWRAAVVVGLAALLGFALTTLFRSTVATLGILFGIALVGGLLLGVLGFEGRWNPAYNVSAVIRDGQEYWVDVECTPEQIEEQGEDFYGACGEERTITIAQGAGYLGAATLGTCLVSLLWFRRRDVP